MFLKQDIMRRVVYSLVPLYLYSIYLYGWRALMLGAIVLASGVLTEYVIEKKKNKKVSEAVLVTSLLFALSLPPAVPFWVAGVGIIFAVVMGKGAYGGFGRNIFNPAITGRMFTYISFPLLMQTTWMIPGMFGLLGMNKMVLGSTIAEGVLMLVLVFAAFLIITKYEAKTKVVLITSFSGVALVIAGYILLGMLGLRDATSLEVDAISMATPLELMRGVQWTEVSPELSYLTQNNLLNLFTGHRVGSMGESAIFLILGAMIYLLVTKTANWKTMIPTLLTAITLTSVLYFTGIIGNGKLNLLNPEGKDLLAQISDILAFLMSGSLLFVAVFMVTDPVSGPNKPLAQVLYGIIIGAVIIVIRVFSGFPEGTSFAILIGNTFANLLDEITPAPKKKPTPPKKTPVEAKA